MILERIGLDAADPRPRHRRGRHRPRRRPSRARRRPAALRTRTGDVRRVTLGTLAPLLPWSRPAGSGGLHRQPVGPRRPAGGAGAGRRVGAAGRAAAAPAAPGRSGADRLPALPRHDRRRTPAAGRRSTAFEAPRRPAGRHRGVRRRARSTGSTTGGVTRVVRPAPGPARRLRPAAGRGQPRAGARSRASTGWRVLRDRFAPSQVIARSRGPWPAPGPDGRRRDPGPRPALRGPGRPAAAAGPGGARGDQQLRPVPASTRAWWCCAPSTIDTLARRRLPAGGDRAARRHRPGRSTTATATLVGLPGRAASREMLRQRRRRPAQPDPPRVRPRRDRPARPTGCRCGSSRASPSGRRGAADADLPDRDVGGARRRGRRRGHRGCRPDARLPQRGLRDGVRDRVVRDALARDQPRRRRRRTTCSTRSAGQRASDDREVSRLLERDYGVTADELAAAGGRR